LFLQLCSDLWGESTEGLEKHDASKRPEYQSHPNFHRRPESTGWFLMDYAYYTRNLGMFYSRPLEFICKELYAEIEKSFPARRLIWRPRMAERGVGG
jgi:hypothetical protein